VQAPAQQIPSDYVYCPGCQRNFDPCTPSHCKRKWSLNATYRSAERSSRSPSRRCNRNDAPSSNGPQSTPKNKWQ
jgi:hypothetical protein